MSQYTGGCSCGRVRFTADGRPNSVGICHCMDCRKHHGAVFYAAAAFSPNSVVIDGKTNAYKGRHFCPICGSSVFAQADGEVEIHLGALDSPNQLTPTYELWCTRREAWLPDFSEIKQYERDRTGADPAEM